MKLKILFLIICFIVFGIIIAVQTHVSQNMQITQSSVQPTIPNIEIKNKLETNSNQITAKVEKNQYRIIMAGDTNLAEHVAQYISEGMDPFQFVGEFMKQFDYKVLNLETNAAYPNTGQRANKPYAFKAPVEALAPLTWGGGGINLVSLANNHTMDYGPQALLEQMRLLEERGINHVGAGNTIQEAFAPFYTTIGNANVAFIAFNVIEGQHQHVSSSRAGTAYFDRALLKNSLDQANSNADVVIVYAHWGNEHSLISSAEQRERARFLIDNGADLVVGAHPHVRQESELYNGKMIYYSLGNFIFAGMGFSKEASTGDMLEIVIENKEIVETKLHTFEIVYHGFPKLIQ